MTTTLFCTERRTCWNCGSNLELERMPQNDDFAPLTCPWCECAGECQGFASLSPQHDNDPGCDCTHSREFN
jgi:hypothetical protein